MSPQGVEHAPSLQRQTSMNSKHLESSNSHDNGAHEAQSVTSYNDAADNDSVGYGYAARGQRAMNRSKCCFFIVLLMAGAIITGSTYHFSKQSQIRDYEHSFRIYAKELTAIADTNVFQTSGMAGSLAITTTSYVLDNPDVSWPLVTVPHFEARGVEARKTSRADVVAFVPMVTPDDKAAWENYSVQQQAWIQEGYDYLELNSTDLGSIPTQIVSPVTNAEFYLPLWETSPPPTSASRVNVDLMANAKMQDVVNAARTARHEILSGVLGPGSPLVLSPAGEDDQPRSYIVEPVFADLTSGADVVGFVIAVVSWTHYFDNVLPEGLNGIVIHVNDGCGTDFTCRINGPKATFVGYGDVHDSRYDSLRETSALAGNHTLTGSTNQCSYTVTVYASSEFESSFQTNGPVVLTCLVVLIFLTTAFLFAVYDWFNRRRQNKALFRAAHTNAIVSSLFPKDVQKRIIEEAEQNALASRQKTNTSKHAPSNFPLKLFEEGEGELENNIVLGDNALSNPFTNRPIADLYLSVTVIFADIVGFTAWSSMREPSQVFTLLETIYHAFDQIAKRRRVFKVETVGDCYVAVCGLPDERKDHAVVMARFARDCLLEFGTLTKDLETVLGPDTGDLGVRIGLHSGQVTAGVLRGERARFQLFGDTMNTTARIESTGERNRIHLSQETADLLIYSGKDHWVVPRDYKVLAKGKGQIQTYWLVTTQEAPASKQSLFSSISQELTCESVELATSAVPREDAQQKLSEKQQRLVNWNTDVLSRMLKEIVASRRAARVTPDPPSRMVQLERSKMGKQGKLVLEEMKEIIELPRFDATAAENQVEPSGVELGERVREQLHSYVEHLAAMYRNNPFHNFEHASHVTMSVVKLLSRIVAPSHLRDAKKEDAASTLHDHTYGITSDPLTQFAVVLSALIHDVDHPGVPNAQLVKEGTSMAAAYKNKSVAEQNSVDLAWNLLMGNEFRDLRRVIYTNEAEFNRFRQLIVNSVMATDIMDKDLGALRKGRWAKAFSGGPTGPDEQDVNRKATIVIEHLIQASDVAHTMQHWHIYRKWNTRFFHEMHRAYKEGRSATNPAVNWYEGEIGFFDFYIIPLAMKLRSCGVFGVSSDEYLNYAQQNREEWQLKGKEIVAQMVEELHAMEARTKS